MIRHALAAIALLAATSLAAQSTTQDELDARYDHALAAGYKRRYHSGYFEIDFQPSV